jgi:hypothetical protein
VNKAQGSKLLIGVGLAAMVFGAIDPLEGSLVIFPGSAMVAVGAGVGQVPHRRLIYWGLGLVFLGVAALWWLSALGGVGPGTGRSMWWLLVVLPYPIGWLMQVIGGGLELRRRHAEAAAAASADSAG